MTLPDQRGTEERGDHRVEDEGKVTLGELGRRLERSDKNNRDDFGKIFQRLDTIDDKFVSRREFDKLEGRMTWIGRAAITGILLPIVVLVLGYLIFGHAAQ